MFARTLFGLILAVCLLACQKGDNATARITPVGCDNSFTVTDYDNVWLFDYEPSTTSLKLASLLKFGRAGVSQANYLCDAQVLAVSYSYRGKRQTDAGIDFIGEDSIRSLSLNEEVANNFVPYGRSVLLGTGRVRRAPIDERLGYLAPNERTDFLARGMPHVLGQQSELEKPEHIFVELLEVAVETATVTRRLRQHNFGSHIWMDGDQLIVAAEPLIAMDINTGVRRKLFDYDEARNVQYGDVQLTMHYTGGRFFAVTGNRVGVRGKSSFKKNAVYALDIANRTWHEVARLPFVAAHMLGAGANIFIFGHHEMAKFSIATGTLTVQPMAFGTNVPTASAELAAGYALILSSPQSNDLPDNYWGGEVLIYDNNFERILARHRIDEIGLVNITSQRTPFPSGPSFSSLL